MIVIIIRTIQVVKRFCLLARIIRYTRVEFLYIFVHFTGKCFKFSFNKIKERIDLFLLFFSRARSKLQDGRYGRDEHVARATKRKVACHGHFEERAGAHVAVSEPREYEAHHELQELEHRHGREGSVLCAAQRQRKRGEVSGGALFASAEPRQLRHALSCLLIPQGI